MRVETNRSYEAIKHTETETWWFNMRVRRNLDKLYCFLTEWRLCVRYGPPGEEGWCRRSLSAPSSRLPATPPPCCCSAAAAPPEGEGGGGQRGGASSGAASCDATWHEDVRRLLLLDVFTDMNRNFQRKIKVWFKRESFPFLCSLIPKELRFIRLNGRHPPMFETLPKQQEPSAPCWPPACMSQSQLFLTWGQIYGSRVTGWSNINQHRLRLQQVSVISRVLLVYSVRIFLFSEMLWMHLDEDCLKTTEKLWKTLPIYFITQLKSKGANEHWRRSLNSASSKAKSKRGVLGLKWTLVPPKENRGRAKTLQVSMR